MRLNISALFLAFLLSALPAGAFGEPTAAGSSGGGEENFVGSHIGAFFARFYGTYISPLDGRECPSVPTCSSYSAQAFRKHGFVMGWLMTVDRLLHEGYEETRVSPFVKVNDRLKIYDPVENNDFWWAETSEEPAF